MRLVLICAVVMLIGVSSCSKSIHEAKAPATFVAGAVAVL